MGTKGYPGYRPKTWRCGHHLVDLRQPAIMGIINATPDSFHASSRTLSTQEALDKAGKMIQEGASILDIGGASSRPGAKELSASEEIDRAVPLVEAISKAFQQIPISIDTDQGAVASAALDAGASIVNDVSAGSRDNSLFQVVAQRGAAYVLMHRQGNAATMQENPRYENVSAEVLLFLKSKLDELTALGIAEVVVDPGFGFGKNIRHNYQLLKSLDLFYVLEKPILVGVSRKSMVTRLLDIPAAEALNATTALHMLSLQNGADILRVHDVKEAQQAIAIYSYYRHTPIDLYATP